jgi:hypothetical protein
MVTGLVTKGATCVAAQDTQLCTGHSITEGVWMIEKTIDITTKAGAMETFICHPERNGPFPAIFFLMDAYGVREELKDMARRLGTVGYYVLLPNLYYGKA